MVGGGAAEAGMYVIPLLLCTFLIVSMQLGFAMLEVGCVRQEHRMTVLAKNLLDTMVSSLSFTLGCELLRPSIVEQDGVAEKHLLLLHWAFLSTSVTICSGSMAERTHLTAYLCYAVVMSGFAYPVLADSVWGNGSGAGFLHGHFHAVSGHGFYDYAGGGVIHLAGGVAALAGNLLLGRRLLRPPVKDFLQSNESPGEDLDFLKEALNETWQRRFDNPEDDEREFRPNSYLQVMGCLTLWVGCYGFNASPAIARRSSTSIDTAALSAWNTTLAAAAGATGAFLHQHLLHRNVDMGFICNGLLSGLVCLTVACDMLTPTTTLLLGFLTGFVVYPTVHFLLRKMRVDDPADAIAVHVGGALFGLVTVAFCRPLCDGASLHAFCNGDHHPGAQLVAQLYGVGTIILWTFLVVFPVWAVFLLSESIYSFELEQLAKTYQHAYVDLEDSEAEGFWRAAARSSRVTRRLLRQHGWTWTGRPFKDSVAASDFRQDVLEAIHSSKTALELDFCLVRVLHRVARPLARCRVLRELALWRLRITPFAELSGLGAVASGGKEAAEVIREVLQVVTDMNQDTSRGPLQLQVEQLSRQVQHQGVLLQRLSRSRRFGGIRHLPSVAESPAPVSAALPRAPDVEDLHEPPMVCCRTQSASTVSDKSLGIITPRSEGCETPHPAVFRHPDMVGQLANLLEAQQRCVAALPTQQEDFHRQLVLALERHAGAPSSRVSRTASEGALSTSGMSAVSGAAL